jgi:hypothetical protein
VRKLDKNHARISVIIEKEVVEQLRNIQAQMINNSKNNVSFSFVVNLVISKGLDKLSKK